MRLEVAQTAGGAAVPGGMPGLKSSGAGPGEAGAGSFRQWMEQQWAKFEPAANAGASRGAGANTGEAGSETAEASRMPQPSAPSGQTIAAETDALSTVSAAQSQGAGNPVPQGAARALSSAEPSRVVPDGAAPGSEGTGNAQLPPGDDSPAAAAAQTQVGAPAAPDSQGESGNRAERIESVRISGANADSRVVQNPSTARAAGTQPVRRREAARKTPEKSPGNVSGRGTPPETKSGGEAVHAPGASSAPAPVAAAPLDERVRGRQARPVAPGTSASGAARAEATAVPVSSVPASPPGSSGVTETVSPRHSSAAAEEHAPAPGTAVPVEHVASDVTPAGLKASSVSVPVPALTGHQNSAAAAPLPSTALPAAFAVHRAAAPFSGTAFDHIDSGMAPQVLSRTPQRLEVGVRDPGLGWVEIRAHAAEGQIGAMVSASQAAHPALAAQLPAMRDYLAGQQVRVDTLGAQPFEASADGGRSAPENRNPGGNTHAAAMATPAPEDAEPESLSWVDVRV